METLEKLRYRAWLLAVGADRWYECVDRVERMKIVEILEEEFARAKASGEPLEKERAFLAKHGNCDLRHTCAGRDSEFSGRRRWC